VSRIFKPFVFVLAGIYFVVDAAIWMLARPVIRWLASWIESLGVWPLARRLALIARRSIGRHVLTYGSREREQVSWQSR
jgi:hypothetical protein